MPNSLNPDQDEFDPTQNTRDEETVPSAEDGVTPAQRFQHMLDRLMPKMVIHNREVGRMHADFLNTRRESLVNLGQLTGDRISDELSNSGMKSIVGSDPGGYPGTVLSPKVEPVSGKKPLFDQHQLEQFATGSIVECLGTGYLVYGSRRTPRIPNGELLLMSRVCEISGTRRNFNEPAGITVEYDVPVNPWFHPAALSGDVSSPDIPYSILMEIALQPCGFLSAYLETPLVHPEEDYYFRNLDGQTILVECPDVRGKTITTRARLEKTTISAGIIIQFFTYSLQIDKLVFFQGQATFGYFPAVTMASQLGLDGGKPVLPWIRNNLPPQPDGQAGIPPAGNGLLITSLTPSSQPPLDHLDELVALPTAGRYDKGYLYARKRIHNDDWYFRCHFLDDPVMPGSLGIEAILKALREYAGKVYTSTGSTSVPRIHPANKPLAWRYRGQIRPHQQVLELEVHITQVIDDASTVTVTGEASLWIDGIRIYEMSPASVTIPKGD